MSEPTLKRDHGLTLEQIVALTGVQARGRGDLVIRNATALEFAGPSDISFADRPGAAASLAATQAGACFVTSALADKLPARTIALVSDNPAGAFIQVANALFGAEARPSSLFEVGGKAENATVHPTARVEPNVIIDPGAVIGPRAEIGSGTVVAAMAVIGPGVCVGRDCVIGPGASIVNALVGDRVTVRAGCRVGEDNPAGGAPGEKSAQFGRVIIQDGVQLGANSTVDRGAYWDTVIGEYARIDNLVRVPADVTLGRHCTISLSQGSQTHPPELLSKFTETGVVPDHTPTDAHFIASFRAR